MKLSQNRSTKKSTSPHQQVVSATSCKDFGYSPLPPSDECHELEDDPAVLLHLVNQTQIDQDLSSETPHESVRGSIFH